MWKNFWVMGGILAAFAAKGANAEPYAAKPGPRGVAILKDDWHDTSRNRDVPVLVCYPSDLGRGGEKLPVIIFSHGLGGTREGYSAYGEHWASYGYVVVFPKHHGSDSGVIGHGMYQMLMGKNDGQAFLDRVGDIHFVIDKIEDMEAGKMEGKQYEPFKGTLDLNEIGMSGHSFGAITTEAIVGENYRGGRHGTFLDHRVKAGIAMSGSGSKGLDEDMAFGSIDIPMVYLTGTEDKSGTKGPADRRVPFDHSKFPDTFLVTFEGANHMTFTPRIRPMDLAGKEKYLNWIMQSTTAFWEAYLKGDEKAKNWFIREFPKELGDGGRFETKNRSKDE